MADALGGLSVPGAGKARTGEGLNSEAPGATLGMIGRSAIRTRWRSRCAGRDHRVERGLAHHRMPLRTGRMHQPYQPLIRRNKLPSGTHAGGRPNLRRPGPRPEGRRRSGSRTGCGVGHCGLARPPRLRRGRPRERARAGSRQQDRSRTLQSRSAPRRPQTSATEPRQARRLDSSYARGHVPRRSRAHRQA